MDLIIPKEIGYCYGVQNAIKKLIKVATEKNEIVYTDGPVIHNPIAVRDLMNRYNIIPLDQIDDDHKEIIAIRAHGISPAKREILKQHFSTIIDTTCPFVRKTQNIAMRLVRDGFYVIILGQKHHPEVIGIMGHIPGNSLVVENEQDLENIELESDQKIGIIFQSTITFEEMEKVIINLKQKYENIQVIETICDVTKRRQQTIKKMTKLVELVIIIGGKNSSNTKKLYETCLKMDCEAIKIENSKCIIDFDFSKYNKVGIMTGTSTPDNIIQEVINYIIDKIGCNVIEMSTCS